MAVRTEDKSTLLQDRLKYHFKNKELLQEARTTSSFSEEHSNCSDYQRLEFLGDRVISLILAEKLVRSGKLDEGIMTNLKSKLESNRSVAEMGEKIGIRDFIRSSEKTENLSKKIIADVFEAICGAIYLDSGRSLKHVELLLDQNDLSGMIENILKDEKLLPPRNEFENKFRERYRKSPMIDFEYIDEGHDHEKLWKIEKMIVDGHELRGIKSRSRMTKKEAEADIFIHAMRYMEEIGWEL